MSIQATNPIIPVILITWNNLDFETYPLVFGQNTNTAREISYNDIDALLNGNNYNYPKNDADTVNTGSVKKYFEAISHGRMVPEYRIVNASTDISNTDLNKAYNIDGNYQDYGEREDSTAALLKPQLSLAYSKAIDNFNTGGGDWNGTFLQNKICFIHAGYGAETHISDKYDYIWSHKWSFSFNSTTIKYFINPVKQQNSGIANIISIGVIAHESLHTFGLPDYYDTDSSSKGAGYLALMASGSWGVNSQSGWLPAYATTYTRSQLNAYFIANILSISGSSNNLSLPPISTTDKSYKLTIPGNTNEYWLIEYRTRTGFDRLLFEDGLAIWHINENANNNNNEYPSNSRGESGYRMSLEAPDGLFNLERKILNGNNGGRLFVPGDVFSPYSTPSTVFANGTLTGIKVHNIRLDNDNMLFDVEYISEPSNKIIDVILNKSYKLLTITTTTGLIDKDLEIGFNNAAFQTVNVTGSPMTIDLKNEPYLTPFNNNINVNNNTEKYNGVNYINVRLKSSSSFTNPNDNPFTYNYVFELRQFNNDTLKTAVNEWTHNNSSKRNNALYKYGPIVNWDTSQVTDMKELFKDKTVFNDALTNWDTSQVTDMSFMFNGCSVFDQNLRSWNVSSSTTLTNMFSGATAMISRYSGVSVFGNTGNNYTPTYEFFTEFSSTVFNNNTLRTAVNEWTNSNYVYNALYKYGPIADWDTSQVTDMKELFKDKTAFNDALTNWDTSQVTDMNFMFLGCTNFVQSVNFDTSKVENMSAMFKNCSSFNQPVIFTDTSEVTNMGDMFRNCSSFNQPVSFDTSKVTRMSYMFEGCSGFDQSVTFNTSLVTSISGMFKGCSIFNSAVTFTDTSQVTNMSNMFKDCSSFNQPVTFDTSSVAYMTWMFESCTIFNQPVTFDTSSVAYMTDMFKDCSNFDQNLRSWNVSSSTTLTNMFSGATAMISRYSGVSVFGNTGNNYTPTYEFFTEFSSTVFNNNTLRTAVNEWTNSNYVYNALYKYGPIADWDTSQVTDMKELFKDKTVFNDALTNWDTSQVTDMSNMFNGCSIFNSDVSFDTSKVEDMSNMFNGCSNFNIAVTFDTSQVTNMSRMFENCSNFNQSVNFDTSQVTNMSRMFEGCSNFNIAVTFDTSQVTDMSDLFRACPIFNSDVSFNDTSQVTNMYAMFANCSNFNQSVDFTTSKVENMSYMFFGCYDFNSDVSFNTSKVTNMSNMFNNCSSFNSDVDFDTSKVTEMSDMFNGCSNFNQPVTFNTSEVTNMTDMFKDCSIFDQNVRSWNVSSSTTLTNMFSGATAMISRYSGVSVFGSAYSYTPSYEFFTEFSSTVFNNDTLRTAVNEWTNSNTRNNALYKYGPIADWDTSQVTDMNELFKDKNTFNEDLSLWDTGNVTNMTGMFIDCYDFSQDIRAWNVSETTTLTNMFLNTFGMTNRFNNIDPTPHYTFFNKSLALICFPAGTPVTTDQGNVAIEKLNTDVHTIRGKEIIAITQTLQIQEYLVCIEKHALGHNVPSSTTKISGEHQVFYKKRMTKAKYLVELCDKVSLVASNEEVLYNVLLEKYDKMMINNLICETLHPEHIVAKIVTSKLSGSEKNRLYTKLSKIMKKQDLEGYNKIYYSL